MVSTSIRIREPGDLPGLLDVIKDVHQTDGYPVEGSAVTESFFQPQGVLVSWVAVMDDQVVGHVLLIDGPLGYKAAVRKAIDHGSVEDKTAVATRLCVRKSARGLGLGRGLIQAAIDYAHSQNKDLVINVLDKDQGAIKLYEKIGFVNVGRGVHVGASGEEYGQSFFVKRSSRP